MAHVGDSRAYPFRAGVLSHVTHDGTWDQQQLANKVMDPDNHYGPLADAVPRAGEDPSTAGVFWPVRTWRHLLALHKQPRHDAAGSGISNDPFGTFPVDGGGRETVRQSAERHA